MIDETVDNSNQDQAVMVFQWVDEFLKLHEEFMGLYCIAQNFDGGNFDVLTLSN